MIVSCCNVCCAVWFGIWSPPLAFFSFFPGPVYFPAILFFGSIQTTRKSSTGKRWINLPRFISSRNNVRFWRSALERRVAALVSSGTEVRWPWLVEWVADLLDASPILTSMSHRRPMMPFQTHLRSGNTRSVSTRKSSAPLSGVISSHLFLYKRVFLN